MFWGLIPTFAEVTAEKLVGRPFCPLPLSWIKLIFITRGNVKRAKAFFSLICKWLQNHICQCWWHQRYLEAWSGTLVLQKPNTDIKTLIEIHINHNQIHHTKIIEWGGFVSFTVTPSNKKVLCVYSPSGHSTRKQMSSGRVLKEFKIIMRMKIREIKKN